MSGRAREALDEGVRLAERCVLELEKQLRVARKLLQTKRAIQKLNSHSDGLRLPSERDLDLLRQYDTGEIPEVKALERTLRQNGFKSLAQEVSSARQPKLSPAQRGKAFKLMARRLDEQLQLPPPRKKER